MPTGPHIGCSILLGTDLAPCYIIMVPYTGSVVAVSASSHLHTLLSAFLARREDDIWSLRDRCSGASGATMENVTSALRSNHRRTRPQNQDMSCWGIDIPSGHSEFRSAATAVEHESQQLFRSVPPRPQSRTKEGSSRCLGTARNKIW
jgi:hypothetical protein